MLLTAVVAALISQLSPFLGLIFLIASGGKRIISDFSHKYVFFVLFSGIVIATAQLGLFPSDIVRYADVLIGLGLGAVVFFNILLKTSKYEASILAFSGYTIIYAYIRSHLFGKFMLQNYDLLAKLDPSVLSMGKSLNPEQLAMFKSVIKIGRDLTDHYNIAIWCIGMIIAVYLGSLLLMRSKAMIWDHKFLKFPQELIYMVIGTMVLIIFPMTKVLGINLLFAILPLYLIQGVAVVDFFWGTYFARSPILRFLLILVMILNYPLLVLLVIVGLFDNWFNYRKIEIREENDENHFVE